MPSNGKNCSRRAGWLGYRVWLWSIAGVAAFCLCQGASSAEKRHGGGGFLLQKNAAGQRVAAEFYEDDEFESTYRSNIDVERKDFIPVDRLPEHPHLEEVFYGYGHVVRAADFAHLAKIKGLRRLEIGFWGSGSEWAAVDGEISKLEVLKQIESLSLNVDGIGDDDLRFVAKLPRLTSIELYAGGAEPHSGRKGPGCTDRCAEHLSKAAGLESLRFHGGAGLSDRFVDRLTAGARNLKELDLDASLVTDESLRMLADRCPKLERLSLSSAERLTDAGVGQLCRLEGIQSLRLSSGGISVEAAARITSLRELCLEGCVVTDQGVAALARLQGLERLVLYGPQLTDEQFGLFLDHPALQHMILNGRRMTRDRTLPVLESMRSLGSASFVGNEALEQAAERMLRERGTPP